jgi:protein phosphatase
VVTAQLVPSAAAEQRLDTHIDAHTDSGGRPENEDAIVVADLGTVDPGDGTQVPAMLMAVADGMGGHQRGEVASRIAVETLRDMFEEDPSGDVVPLLKQAFRRANEQIHSDWTSQTPSQLMGTTLVAAVTRGKYATIASIGDSRAYLVRADRLQQITRDHSLVAEQVASGQINADEARDSPHRNIILHALGQKPKLDTRMPNIFEITLLPEDRLLLLTDGFFDVVPDDDLRRITLETPPDMIASRLCNVAKERGTTDNVSAIVTTVMPKQDLVLATAQTAALGRNGQGPVTPTLMAIAAVILLAIIGLVLFLLL